jgi:hypothetical protein
MRRTFGLVSDISFRGNLLCHRPLEVIGHDGKATNITMLPGDLVLYESHSVLHGVGFVVSAALVVAIDTFFDI